MMISRRFIASSSKNTLRCVLAPQKVMVVPCATAIRHFSAGSGGDSITYSGGQAMVGQGGYYGSGGARVIPTEPTSSDDPRSAVLAMAADVQKIADVMDELETFESLLRREKETGDSAAAPTSKSIEIKASIKKLMTAPDVVEALNRLEIQGEPVWGLCSEEREMIVLAREKVNKG